MRLTISHTTAYSYDQPVSYGLQRLRLQPLTSRVQNVQNWSIDAEGAKPEAEYVDHFGNATCLMQVIPGVQQVQITASGVVDTLDPLGIYGTNDGGAPLWVFQHPTDLTRPGAGLRALVKPARHRQPGLDDLHALSAALLDAVPYRIGETYTETTAEEALKGGSGVCQDHAHLFVAAARLCGLPARYVSGYLLLDDRIDQDANHAWAEAFIDGMGWVGFDVSNGISPDERYVRLAVGRDAKDAAPLSGLRLGNASESLMVSLQIQQ